MNDVLLCPLRKTIKEVQDSVPLTKMETFQACLKKNAHGMTKKIDVQ